MVNKLYEGIKRNLGKIASGAIALSVVGLITANELSYSREYLQINEGQVKPLYRVFRKDDGVIFRLVGSDGELRGGIMSPNLVGTVDEGFDHAVQPIPVRGIGVQHITRNNPRWERYEENFNYLLEKYKANSGE